MPTDRVDQGSAAATMGSDGGGGSGSGIGGSGSRALNCNDSRYGGSGADAGQEHWAWRRMEGAHDSE